MFATPVAGKADATQAHAARSRQTPQPWRLESAGRTILIPTIAKSRGGPMVSAMARREAL